MFNFFFFSTYFIQKNKKDINSQTFENEEGSLGFKIKRGKT